jgi:hypothetical protein
MSRLKYNRLLMVGVFAVVIMAVAFCVAMVAAGAGSAAALTTASDSSTTNATTTYVLTLVITTQNTFNSSIGQQPAYYVLGTGGLESSANISIPSNEPIELIIMNYDDGNATLLDPQYANVTGIPGGIYVVSDAGVNSSQGLNGIAVNETSFLTDVPASLISHTFTVPGLLNIPVEVSSTTVAYFTATTPGTYQWTCMTECGAGPNGTEGAMATPGWMTGSFVVLPAQSAPGQTTVTSAGINAELTTVAILGALFIGLFIGLLYRRSTKMQK